MSFSYDCKLDIISMNRKECCTLAFLYGLFAFSGSLNKDEMKISMPTQEMADHVISMFRSIGYSVDDVSCTAGRRCVTACFASDDMRDRFLTDLGLTGEETTIHVNRENFMCESCRAAFVSGAFCASGSVTNPESGYHLEFSTFRQSLFNEFCELLSDVGFPPKTIKRGYNKVIYYKGSSQIEDLLTFMGAYDGSMKIMDRKIYKEISNKINRRMNCESANMDKAIAASMNDINDIKLIFRTKGEAYLSEELLDVARIRVENPELSLSELGAIAGGLSKSGISHRLAKIRREAAAIREELDAED